MIYTSVLIPVSLAVLLSTAPARANTTDGLIIGGFAGLTAGLITSAIAHHASHHHHNRTVYVEQPHCIRHQPVVVEQVIEHRPVVVEERIRPRRMTCQSMPVPQPVQVTVAPSLAERELALKEQQMKLDLLKEENRKSELKIREIELELQRSSTIKKA
jgi:hypothetical protein